ncbi:MAG: polyisoprenoid-binding protein [Ignavibacteriae bacterium]|nr:polyisoprenoid-binding protein [Ignavibacteriota bacterium]
MKNTIFLFILTLITAFSLSAQTTWKIDASHSKVLFTVSHMVISEVTGRFTDFDATLIQNGNDFSSGTLNAIIKTASVNTDNDARDKHLRSADFFDAEKNPEITFVSKSFEKTGKDTYKITGDFTLRGVTKAVSLDAKFNGTMKDPWGNTKAGFKATTTINRMDFGAKWNKALEAGGLLVGENVDITLQVELQQQANEKQEKKG